jgi:signal transduction histidine kinase
MDPEQGVTPSASQALESEREKLRELQNTFVSIVSHELQTPIAIIKAYAGTIRRPDAAASPAIVLQVAATIESECDRLSRLITDLLDLARIQAGRVAMAYHPVDLGSMLGELVDDARLRAPEAQIVLEDVGGLPIVRGDSGKLRMALNNLLDNALKYSPRGGVITLGGAQREDEIVVWVRDEGIGVPPEERERIFERFHRVDSRLSRERPGVGMGLYICRVIVEAHNGRVWVESGENGQGSSFFIALPLVPA